MTTYTSIALSFIIVLALFVIARLLKKHIVASLVAMCFMGIAAVSCITNIKAAVPEMQNDLETYTNNYAGQLIGDYGIDSSMVELPEFAK